MKKNEFAIRLPYTYNPEHKGAPYTIDGEHWFNGGDLHEMLAKDGYGYKPVKDANSAYDVASDIPEMRASVKSSGATLVNRVLGYDFDSVLNHYFATVHSDLWIWAVKIDETLVTYEMDRNEFEKFVREWAGFLADRKVIRFKKTSGKMIKWLEAQI